MHIDGRFVSLRSPGDANRWVKTVPMATDKRKEAAVYYDLNPTAPEDVPFYKKLVPSPRARVLELGCGTGRVLISLIEACGYVHGIDSSEAMLARCRAKLKSARIPTSQAQVERADVARFDLGRAFDFIVVPFVFQILQTDEEIDGLFDSIRRHLGPAGTCIINSPKPPFAKDVLRREWCDDREHLAWEVQKGSTRFTCHKKRCRMDREKLVLYPELVYRRYENGVLKDENVMSTVMKCWYPDEFKECIAGRGFKIVGSWGGYAGERYGEGPELLIQFAHGG